MNAMYVLGHLHNDISPDNIMFHFHEDELHVYTGVCDWSMTIVCTDPMKSLYTFTSTSDMDKALRRRWWVDPSIVYEHRRNVDVKIIPNLSRKSKEFVIDWIA